MSRFFLYAHGGSGNHGCEAIVRSTAGLLKGEDLCLISSRPEEDSFYGLDELCSVIRDKNIGLQKKNLDFWKAYLALKIKKDFVAMDKLQYTDAFSHIQKGDIALSIGGDNYCYADVNKYVMLHDMLKKRGAKTVLWGCSVEPDVVAKPHIAADLARYDLIMARETISYEALKAVNPNTHLVADPAFLLETEETQLPEGFVPGNTVGINLSPMAMERESVEGMAYANYKCLIEHLIEHTDMQIALIPHVIWEDGDDRLPMKRLYDAFAHTGRIVMVEDCNCRKLKYIISKCRFFIGARTHATIAAYSTCVPTLVLGYSIKSRGIARDLFGTEKNYVVPVQSLVKDDDLLHAFLFISNSESEIKETLKRSIAGFQQRARDVAALLR